MTLEVYNAQRELIGTTTVSGQRASLSAKVTANETLFIRLAGSSEGLSLRLTNLAILGQAASSALDKSSVDFLFRAVGTRPR